MEKLLCYEVIGWAEYVCYTFQAKDTGYDVFDRGLGFWNLVFLKHLCPVWDQMTDSFSGWVPK